MASCKECGQPINQGEQFVNPGLDADGQLIVIHANCAKGEDARLKPRTMTIAREQVISTYKG